MLGIEKGSVLQFKKDPNITCEVYDETKVIFRGEVGIIIQICRYRFK